MNWTVLHLPLHTLPYVLSDCGKAPLNTVPGTTNGSDATVGSWPWEASWHFSFMDGHICGETLINKQRLLTAALLPLLRSVSDAWVVYLTYPDQAQQPGHFHQPHQNRSIWLAGNSSQFFSSTPHPAGQQAGPNTTRVVSISDLSLQSQDLINTHPPAPSNQDKCGIQESLFRTCSMTGTFLTSPSGSWLLAFSYKPTIFCHFRMISQSLR